MTAEATGDSTSAAMSAGGESVYATVLQRHPGDGVRVVLGLVALAVSALVVRHTHLPRLDVDLLRLVNDLPSWVSPVLLVVMQLGSLGAVGVAAGTALAARRFGLARALAAAGLCPIRVAPVSLDARGSRPFLVTTENCGECTDLFVKVIGYHERNSDLLFKLFRHAVFREIEDESPFATPKQEAEHEAFVALLAHRSGVRTPAIVSVGVAENGDAWLAEERVPGRNLARSMSQPVSDDVLCDVWCQVPLLRAARIAHRDLRLANFLIDEHDKPWIVDFGFAESGASEHRLDADVAELLESMSQNVGVKRAAAIALRVLGPDPLRGAAPLLQPLALASATRKAVKQ